MAEQELNIYQKLAKIRKQVEVIQRNKSGYGYKYVSEDEILAKISHLYGQIQLIPYPKRCPQQWHRCAGTIPKRQRSQRMVRFMRRMSTRCLSVQIWCFPG